MDSDKWLMALSERFGSRMFDTPFDELTVPERVFVAIWMLEADVNNGGFDQYYLNSAGDHAWFAPEALRAIGAERTAALVEQANAAFGPGGPSPDREVRLRTHEEVAARARALWDDLDRAFYTYEDDLTTLLRAYVERHASEIHGAGRTRRTMAALRRVIGRP